LNLKIGIEIFGKVVAERRGSHGIRQQGCKKRLQLASSTLGWQIAQKCSLRQRVD
jgi:hypothetical protein